MKFSQFFENLQNFIIAEGKVNREPQNFFLAKCSNIFNRESLLPQKNV